MPRGRVPVAPRQLFSEPAKLIFAVRGMLLDRAEAPARLDEDSAILHFCSRACRAQYEEERGKRGTEAVV